jgi:hypothetical protein
MINSERTFVNAVQKYCDNHGIAVQIKSQGWLVVMQRGATRRFAFGYDLGLNGAVAHRIANDKAATADVLEICGIACVPHALFLSPKLYKYIPQSGSWKAMLELLEGSPKGLDGHSKGIVVKPNEGTGGNSVFKVSKAPELEIAVHEIFSSNTSLAISPYLEIEEEVRVILIDYRPIVVYSKSRPSIVGDGKRSLLELAVAATPARQLSTVLPGLVDDLDKAALDAIPSAGQLCVLNWRHNLGAGAQPVLLEQGATREACVQIATEAAKAINMKFGSIDVVRVDGCWRILEINSGVMMEALSRLHPDLVDLAYGAALDKLFQ